MKSHLSSSLISRLCSNFPCSGDEQSISQVMHRARFYATIKCVRRGKMTQYQLVTFGALEICYLEKLDGGGIALEKDFVALVKQRFGKVNRICEWCSGPGFIGFSLLAHGLCSTLCLIVINPEAVEA